MSSNESNKSIEFNIPTVAQEIFSCNIGIFILGLYFLLEFGSIQGLYSSTVNQLRLPTIVAFSSLTYATYIVISGKLNSSKLSVYYCGLCLYVIGLSYLMTINSIVFENNLKLFLVYLSNYIVIQHSVKTLIQYIFIIDIYLASVAFTCLHGILQGGLVWSSIWFSDENQFALLCCTTIPFAYILLGYAKSHFKKACYIFCLTLYFIGIIVAASRGGFLSCIVVVIGLWIYTKRKFKTITLVICLLVLVVNIIPPKYIDRLKNEFTDISVDEQAGTVGDRKYLWRLGIDMFKTHWLFGVGPFNYSELMVLYDQRAEARDTTGGVNWKGQKWVAHSTPISILAEFGIAGATIFFIVQFAVVKQWYRMRKMINERDVRHLIEARVSYGLATAAVIAQFSFWTGSIFLTLTWWPFWYILVSFSGLILLIKNNS